VARLGADHAGEAGRRRGSVKKGGNHALFRRVCGPRVSLSAMGGISASGMRMASNHMPTQVVAMMDQ
jgi:hypothetical protein